MSCPSRLVLGPSTFLALLRIFLQVELELFLELGLLAWSPRQPVQLAKNGFHSSS
jgi:hypothetical protein